MAPSLTRDTATVQEALRAAQEGNRAAFDAAWEAASEAERWTLRGYVRLGLIGAERRRLAAQGRGTPPASPSQP